jgi:TonB family protein
MAITPASCLRIAALRRGPALCVAALLLALLVLYLPDVGAQTQIQTQRGFGQVATSAGTIHNGDYYALVIGIDDYPAPLHQLKTAVNDARAVGQLLQGRYGFKVEYLLNEDATRYKILSALGKYRMNLHEDDNLLIYFGGHGYYDRDTDRAYWLPVDADSGTSPNTIMADEVTTLLRALPLRHVLVVSDSCYSGGLSRSANEPAPTPSTPSYLIKELKTKSRSLMSSGGNEPVTDSGANGHSVFANAILKGLEQENDSLFAAKDLFYTSIRKQVASNSDQIPQYTVLRNSSDDGGDFIFTHKGLPSQGFGVAGMEGLTGASKSGIPKMVDISSAVAGGLLLRQVQPDYPAIAKAARVQGTVVLQATISTTGTIENLRVISGNAMLQNAALDAVRQWKYKPYLLGGNPVEVETTVNVVFTLGDTAVPASGTTATSSSPTDGYTNGVQLANAGNFKEAVPLLSGACDGGSGPACTYLAYMYVIGNGVAKDLTQAFNRYHKACDAGDLPGCLMLGVMYANGEGVDKDEPRAVSLYGKACDAGFAQGCTYLGGMYEMGKGVGKDSSKAVNLLRKACDAGHAQGCAALGAMYAAGVGVDRADTQAVSLYRKACDGGFADGCNNLGLMYAAGKGVTKDEAEASKSYRKACDGGNLLGCYNLGTMYQKGTGIGQDYVEAVSLFRKACDGGYAGGCTNLGFLYSLGNGVDRDASQALGFFRRACDGGEPMGCNNLGINYEKGIGVGKDSEQAISSYKKACAAGLAQGCANVKRLQP